MKKLLAIAIASFVFAGTAHAIDHTRTVTSIYNGKIKSVGSSVTKSGSIEVISKGLELNNGSASGGETILNTSKGVSRTNSRYDATFFGNSTVVTVGNVSVGNSSETQNGSSWSQTKSKGKSFSGVIGNQTDVLNGGNVTSTSNYASFEKSRFNDTTTVTYDTSITTTSHFAE